MKTFRENIIMATFKRNGPELFSGRCDTLFINKGFYQTLTDFNLFKVNNLQVGLDENNETAYDSPLWKGDAGSFWHMIVQSGKAPAQLNEFKKVMKDQIILPDSVCQFCDKLASFVQSTNVANLPERIP